MKKKRFYKNVKRNTKWTEEEKGYPIDFADKYASDEGIYSDKFDYMRPKIKKKRKHKAQARTLLKRLGHCCIMPDHHWHRLHRNGRVHDAKRHAADER